MILSGLYVRHQGILMIGMAGRVDAEQFARG